MATGTDGPLELLTKGILTFQRDVYPCRRETFESATKLRQRPHTLRIPCADSQVDTELLTQSKGSELLVTRNRVPGDVRIFGEETHKFQCVRERAAAAQPAEPIA